MVKKKVTATTHEERYSLVQADAILASRTRKAPAASKKKHPKSKVSKKK